MPAFAENHLGHVVRFLGQRLYILVVSNPLRICVLRKFAESHAERIVIGVRQRLPAKINHFMPEKRVSNLLELRVRHLGDVDTDDLGAHRRRQRPRLDVFVGRRVIVEFSGRMQSHGSHLGMTGRITSHLERGRNRSRRFSAKNEDIASPRLAQLRRSAGWEMGRPLRPVPVGYPAVRGFHLIGYHEMSEPTFDYIVIGAGTAGALVANRLSADPKCRVLLVEAGPRDNYHWVHVPVGYLYCNRQSARRLVVQHGGRSGP